MAVVATGLFGKIPSRGDFVRVGLPRAFVEEWDSWLSSALLYSQAALKDEWLKLYLEAPIWHFRLAAGVCGAWSILGAILPSIDKAGRYYPLTFAAMFDDIDIQTDLGWLASCDSAGREALEMDRDPEQLVAMIATPATPQGRLDQAPRSQWWTEGAPHVPATNLQLHEMPDRATYVLMLSGHKQTLPDDQNCDAGLGLPDPTVWKSKP